MFRDKFYVTVDVTSGTYGPCGRRKWKFAIKLFEAYVPFISGMVMVYICASSVCISIPLNHCVLRYVKEMKLQQQNGVVQSLAMQTVLLSDVLILPFF